MRNQPFKGEINIGQFSSLRKLMRAAARNKLPDERLGIIQRAMEVAKKRENVYLSSYRRTMNARF